MIRLSIVEHRPCGIGWGFEPSETRRPIIDHAGVFENAPARPVTGSFLGELLENSIVTDGMIGRGQIETRRFIGDPGVIQH